MVEKRRHRHGFRQVCKRNFLQVKPRGSLARINPMNETVSAALIGAIAGYLLARHGPEIAWLLHTLMG